MSATELLRRADWRFLLPGRPLQAPLVVRGGPAGFGEALGTGGEPAVTAELPRQRAAGAVALLEGADDVEAAASALIAGGALYWEPRRGQLRRAAQRVEAAGLVVAGRWAVWPRTGDERAWLPLDGGDALPWFARTACPAWTWRRRLVRLALLRGRPTLLRDGALLAVAPGADATPALLRHPAVAAVLGSGSHRVALLAHGAERAVMVPFPAAGGAPRALLKVPRGVAANGRTEAEQAALAAARASLSPGLRDAVPEPLGTVEWSGLAVGIESCASGRTLASPGRRGEAGERRSVADLQAAAGWLTGMHAATEQGRPAWDAAAEERWLLAPAEAYRRRHGSEPAVEALVAAATRESGALAGVPLPLVLRHRDFTPWNLLRDGDRLAVLDWEGAEPGPALCDLLHFAAHWHELATAALVPSARLRAFADWLDHTGRLAAAAWEAVARYTARLGVDSRFVPLLHVATRLEVASRAHATTDGFDCRFVRLLADRRESLFARAAA